MTTLSSTSTPDIEIQNVVKKFPNSSEPTLKGLSLTVEHGKIHSIIGASGIGKSVTLKLVLGFLKPDSGTVKIKGQDLAPLDGFKITKLRSVFGMLFQNSALFDSLSVFENVAFPLREHRRDWKESQIRERVQELLQLVKLESADKKLPAEISGGMRKRVGLARAIALEPQIILCDEPTTGLDPVTSRIVDDLIEETTRKLGASALIISHDVHAALRMSDFVSMLAEGKILETSSPADFRKSQEPLVRQFLESAGVV